MNKLERQSEEMLAAIVGLQRVKTLGASIFAYIFGCIAALIFGGGMCLATLMGNSIPALVGGIILGILGMVLYTVNYFIYKKMVEKKTKQILPIIDDNEEKFANFLEKGNDLLRTEII